MDRFLVADLFCGAGGSSTGAEKAVRAIGGEMVLVAVNHWPVAIETHSKNHPNARHYCVDLDAARPEVLVPEGRLDLLMASPECVFFSRARGGKPVNDQRRMSAWHVQRWTTALDVRCLLIENVAEFIDWGPLLASGKPDPQRKGLYFQAWHKALLELGYDVDFRILNAADHGDATTRRRFFLQARKDGLPIRWPDPSHSPTGGADMFGGLQRWRAAREVIEWANPGRSLLDDPRYRRRPLSEKTRRRIARGLAKFGGPLAPMYINLLGLEDDSTAGSPARGFLLPQRENNLPKSVDEPVPTIVARTCMRLVEPTLEPFILRNNAHATAKSTDEPLPTATGATGGGLFFVEPQAEPFVLSQASGGAARSVTEPIPTMVGRGGGALAQPMIAPYYGNGSGETCTSVEAPLPTVTTKARFGLAEPMAVPYGPRTEARSVDEPLPTILTKDRLGLATPTAEPFVLSRNGHSEEGGRLRPVSAPLATITASGSGTGYLVEPFIVPQFGERDGQEPRVHGVQQPVPAVTGHGAGALVQPLLVQTDQTGGHGDYVRTADAPLTTIVTKQNVAIVEPILQRIESGDLDPRRVVLVDGVPHLLDIRFRMLNNRELARAMGFDDAEVEYEFVGTVEQVTKQIGNAVPVNLAAALVTAILGNGPVTEGVA